MVQVSSPWKLHFKLEILSELRSEFYLEPGELGDSGEESQAGPQEVGGARKWAELWPRRG